MLTSYCWLQKLDKANRSNAIRACIEEVESQMLKDQKTTGLKALQGLIWHNAFTAGAIRAQIFPDVPHALQTFSASGIKTYIYSSGSRQAQSDCFGHAVVSSFFCFPFACLGGHTARVLSACSHAFRCIATPALGAQQHQLCNCLLLLITDINMSRETFPDQSVEQSPANIGTHSKKSFVLIRSSKHALEATAPHSTVMQLWRTPQPMLLMSTTSKFIRETCIPPLCPVASLFPEQSSRCSACYICSFASASQTRVSHAYQGT